MDFDSVMDKVVSLNTSAPADTTVECYFSRGEEGKNPDWLQCLWAVQELAGKLGYSVGPFSGVPTLSAGKVEAGWHEAYLNGGKLDCPLGQVVRMSWPKLTAR